MIADACSGVPLTMTCSWPGSWVSTISRARLRPEGLAPNTSCGRTLVQLNSSSRLERVHHDGAGMFPSGRRISPYCGFYCPNKDPCSNPKIRMAAWSGWRLHTASNLRAVLCVRPVSPTPWQAACSTRRSLLWQEFDPIGSVATLCCR